MLNPVTKHSLIGVGLYSVAEAARLTKTPPRSISRWVKGYAYKHSGELRDVPPVWKTDVPELGGTLGLSFLDLMEIRFVQAFRRSKVPWKIIRLAAARACEAFDRDHPFSTQRFKTDGRTIFLETLESTGEKKLLDLARSQYAFHKVISPSLYTGLVFSDFDQVVRWFPKWPGRKIVIDPERAFGRPILSDQGVPTEVLANAYRTEGSMDNVAKWYDVDPESVRRAVAFERDLDL